MEHKDIYINCLSFQLTQARKRVFSFYEQSLAPLGLTPSYVYVLGILKDLGSSNLSEISKFLELEKPTVTNILNRMERSGLIKKTDNPKNRREIRIFLTEEGKKACDIAYPILLKADNQLNELLGGDLSSLQEKLTILNTHLKERLK